MPFVHAYCCFGMAYTVIEGLLSMCTFLVFQLTHNKGHLQCTIEQHVLKHMWGDEKLIAKAKMHRKLGFF